MKKILMVDDEEDIDQLILQKFRKEIQAGTLSFFFSRDGYQALELMAKKNDIDLVITDINMPSMNGIELLYKIKKIMPHTKVIMVSAYTDDHNQALAKRAGSDGFITKPMDLKILEKLIMDS